MSQSDLSMLGFGRDVYEEEHEAFRTTMRRFFQDYAAPNVKQWENDGFFPSELFREAGKLGLLCAGIPPEYGGPGGDVRHHVIFHEEHGYSTVGPALEAGLATDITSHCIFSSGTEEQKKQWLPQIAAGEDIIEIAMSEPGAGTDARGIKTYAQRDGDDYILNGQKMWISNGPLLTSSLVLARTSPDASSSDMTLFYVPTDSKGVTVSRPTDLMIKTAGGLSEIFLDDVRVPKANIVGGEPGKGLRASLSLMVLGRVATAAKAMAACEVALAITLDYVKNRPIFDHTVFDFQNTRFKLATCATEIAASQAMLDRSIKRLVEGTCDGLEAAKVKLFCTEVEWRVMDECLQLHGAAGLTNEFPISKMYGVARLHRIFGGTSETMRDVIGRAMG